MGYIKNNQFYKITDQSTDLGITYEMADPFFFKMFCKKSNPSDFGNPNHVGHGEIFSEEDEIHIDGG